MRLFWKGGEAYQHPLASTFENPASFSVLAELIAAKGQGRVNHITVTNSAVSLRKAKDEFATERNVTKGPQGRVSLMLLATYQPGGAERDQWYKT